MQESPLKQKFLNLDAICSIVIAIYIAGLAIYFCSLVDVPLARVFSINENH